MAKKRTGKSDPAPKPADTPFHSAFAGLASLEKLREQLPAGDAPVESAPAAPQPEPSAPGKVVVRRERKGRKGKTVTRISGIGAERDAWARRMKHSLGCGGSVEDEDIVLAGDVGDRAAAWLESAGIRRVIRGS